MKIKQPIGILGATGMVGQRYIQLLENHPWFEVAWLAASDRSSGKTYGEAAKWRLDTPLPERIANMTVSPAETEGAPKIIFASIDAAYARELEPKFAAAGCAVVSNSSAFRMAPNVPLVLPEVNADHLHLIEEQSWRKESGGYIVTNSNCTVMGPVLALKPIADRFGIEQIFATSMQAVSGAGYPGVASMDILDNVVPYIANEEEKMEEEMLKLLGKLNGHAVEPLVARMSASCNRVPVVDGHTVSVSIKLGNKLGRPATREEILAAWAEFRPLGRSKPAQRSRSARPVGAAARPPAAPPGPQSRQWHGRDRRPSAPMRRARLEVHRALAQHHSRSRRSHHPQRRTAGKFEEAVRGFGFERARLQSCRRCRKKISRGFSPWSELGSLA